MTLCIPLADAKVETPTIAVNDTRQLPWIRIFFVSVSLLPLSLAASAQAQSTTPKESANDGDEVKARVAHALEAGIQEANKFEFYFAGDPETKLTRFPTPILKFSNSDRMLRYSNLFIWTHQGRPEVVAAFNKLYEPDRRVGAAVRSLSLEKLKGRRNGEEIWHPRSAGVELQAIRDSGPPADEPVQRLRQMRSLAREFTAEYKRVATYSEHGKLRLMPRPLYRYESAQQGVLDGAIFTFALGTSPALPLIIEARKTALGYVWQFAAARSTAWSAASCTRAAKSGVSLNSRHPGPIQKIRPTLTRSFPI